MHFPQPTATTHHLDNGLTVILDPHSAHPVISTQLWVETGSIHEGSWLGAGLSHFLEHMVFKGTKNFDGARLASVVQAAGGHWNAYTTFDRTVYYIDGPSSGTDIFLQILSEMVFRPSLPESEFALEKDVIRREIDMGLDDPSNAAMRLIFDTAFRQDPRRLPVIGHRSLFDQVTHADLLQYHRDRYTPNRAFFVVSGDFDPAVVLAKITELSSDLSTGYGTEPYIALDPPQCSLRQAEATFAIPTSRITIAWKIPSLGHPDAPVYDLLAAMLGRGRSSHLYTELREKKELALEISAWSWTGNIGEGLFAVSAETEPENRQLVIDAVRSELAAYATMDYEIPLARAKRQLMVSQYRSLTSASGRAGDLASNWHDARDLHFTRNYLSAIDKITADDVRRCLLQLQDHQLSITQLNPIEVAPAAVCSITDSEELGHRTITLQNGVTVALFPDARVPLVSVQTVVRCGLPAESMRLAGLGSLVASTLTKGTKHRNAFEISSTLEGLGASLHASTGNNSMMVSGSCLSPDLPVLLEILGDVITHPSFPADALQREIASQRSSIRESQQDPLDTAFHQLRRLLFGEQNYGIPAMGTEESMAVIVRDDLIAHHARYFQANNMTVAIAGDFEPSEVVELLEKQFAELPVGDRYEAPASSLFSGRTEINHRDKKQAVLTLGFPGLSAHDPRRFACSMLLEYCADMAGPLFTRIREELGLAYQVGATQFHGHDAGMLAFYVSTSPEQLDLAHAELRKEIEKIARNGIPDEEFEQVRATVLSSLVLQQQSPGSIARQAAIDLLFGLPADHHRHVHQEIMQLRPEDIRQLSSALLLTVDPVTSIVTQGPDQTEQPLSV